MLVRTRSEASTSAMMASTSASRPGPESPEASGPSSGPTKRSPRERSVRTLACVAAAFHICASIAGAITSGAAVASTNDVSASGASPCTSRAIRSAVAGASTTASATSATSTCSTWPRILPTDSIGSSKRGFWSPHSSVTTGLPESAWNVSGVTNSHAALVITTRTVAPRSRSRRTSSQAL